MNSKKIVCAFLAAILSYSAVSCGKSRDSSIEESDAAGSEESEMTEETAEDKTEDGSGNIDINDYFTDETPSPALWKVTDPETGNELYMMGTIHVVSENKFSLPDYIMDVYEKCDGIAVEYNVNELNSDMSLMQEFLASMVYSDGTTIKDHISEETYEKAKACFEEMGAYSSFLDYYMPGLWISQIQSGVLLNIDNMSAEGVDSTFITYAENDGKEVINIETLDIQADAIVSYSDDLAEYVLSDLVDNIDDVEAMAEAVGELYNLWASGDIDAMEETDDESEEMPDDLKDDYEEYQEIALYNRNKGMADRAAEFIENGDNYFYMVGSLHFSGNKGVDDLLEEMGYTVERIA